VVVTWVFSSKNERREYKSKIRVLLKKHLEKFNLRIDG
jgi:hypothetical protein